MTSCRRSGACLARTGGSGCIGFREFVNAGFTELAEHGLSFYDLEADVRCFNAILPRIRIIPLEEFDPVAFL